MRQVSLRCAALICAAVVLVTGCQTVMSKQPDNVIKPPPETYAVPLRFARHDFAAYCYNTLNCSVVYNEHQFTRYAIDTPMSAPSSPNYKDAWGFSGYLGIRNFPPPADVRWTSLDGVKHEAKVDIAAIFKDQLVWHKVPKSDMADFYSGPVAGEPNIYLEVNDHIINVYMMMLIPTKTEQIPGNKLSYARNDMYLVWTRSY